MEVALEGIRILDLSQYLSAPFASMLLADLGAEVIKIEPIDLNPEIRKMPLLSEPDPHGAGFIAVNRNKRSLALDLRQPKGREIFHELVKVSDVVMENFRPGTTKRLGADFETLLEINPRILSCSLTAFGSSGPYSSRPAFDLVLQAMSGAMALGKDWPDNPQQIAMAVADTAGGVYLAIAILSALFRRERTGRGERVETSMLAAMMSMMTFDSAGTSAMGLEPKMLVAPYGTFKTKDGWLVIAAHRSFRPLCTVLGLEELVDDERFATIHRRAENKKELNEAVAKKFLSRNTEEWLDLLNEADIPCSKVNSLKEALDNPQAHAEGLMINFDYVRGGNVTTVGNAVKLASTPPEKRARYFSPPLLGQHSAEVLVGILGYSHAQIEELREQSIIRCE